MKKKLRKIMNSPHTILAVYTLVLLFVIFSCNSALKKNQLYEFEGSSETFVLDSGLIYKGRDINRFNGAFISYLGDKEKVLSYDIGYYLQDGTIISSNRNSGTENVTFNLKEILNMSFTMTEKAKNALVFDEKKIDSKIYFKIDVIFDDGSILQEEIELNLYKLTK